VSGLVWSALVRLWSGLVRLWSGLVCLWFGLVWSSSCAYKSGLI
jgi:hypothetical protein